MRKEAIVAIAFVQEIFIAYEKYSSLNKLCRVIAFIRRFIYNSKRKKDMRRIGSISGSEMSAARSVMVREVQSKAFIDEIRRLKKGESMLKQSRLSSLNPFLDEMGVLRVGGRLKNSSLPEDTKHPVVLPTPHHFTTLIITDLHERLFQAFRLRSLP